ncbi:MAG: TolC family protein [Bacteroidota bacterium]
MKALCKCIFLFFAISPLVLKAQLMPTEKAELDSILTLALNNAHVAKALNEKLSQQQKQLAIEKLSWLSGIDVGLQFFSMEQQVSGVDGETSYTGSFIPQVGGSLRLSLHKLITTPQRIKIARSELKKTDQDKEATLNDIESWITLKYFELVQARRQVALSQELLISQEQAFTLIKQKFERNEAKLEDFLKVQNAVHETKGTLIKHELSVEKFSSELSIVTNY